MRWLFVFILSLFISSCSSSRYSSVELEQSAVQTRLLVERYGLVQPDPSQNILADITERLLGDRSRWGISPSSLKILLLNTSEPLAFSPGGDTIAISRGLVRLLQVESELAFVIAHELAHQILRHPAEDTSDLTSSSNRKEMELDADKLGVKIMIMAGYDPRSAINAVVTIYQGTQLARLAANYPTPEARTSQILSTITALGWIPPATIDRRDYQVFRHNLMMAKS